MRSFFSLAAGLLTFLVMVSPVHPETLSIFENGINKKDIDRVLSDNPLGPEENIRAILLHTAEDSSIHLVQIRVGEEPHIHRMHDLFVTQVRGEGRLFLQQSFVVMKAGDSVFIPRGVLHYFENTSEEVAVALAVFTPPYKGEDRVLVPGQ